MTPLHRIPFRGVLAAVALVGAAGTAFAGDPAGGDPLAAVTGGLGEPVSVAAVIEPGTAGGPDMLAVTATIDEGWHVYAVTQPPGGPTATRITIADGSPRRTSGEFTATPAPRRRTVEDVPAWQGLPIEEHAGSVTWRAPLAAGTGDVRGSVRLQPCQDGTCLPPRTIAFTAGSARPVTAVTGPASFVEHVPERAHVTIRAAVGASDGLVPLEVELVPHDGWHLYRPAGSAASEVGQGKPTVVSSGSGGTAAVVAVRVARAAPAAGVEAAAAGAVDGPIGLRLDLAPASGSAAPAEAVIGFQTCSEQSCDPPTAIRIAVSRPGGPARAEIVSIAAAKYSEAAGAVLPLAAAADPVAPVLSGGPGTVPAEPPRGATLSLPLALAMGLLGGLLLNLMPCVLPVLGLKLMSFAQQAGLDRRELLRTTLWHCVGVFAVFMGLATASVAATIGLGRANLAWGEQFTSTGFNVTMIAVVFAFALSFLGVWELPIPGFIGERAGRAQSQEGPMGSFLKGALGTLLATPCSGPFLGPVFGFTLTQPTPVTYAVFAAIAAGMCLPYVAVGTVPGMARLLPRPGAWMATFKELLGFVLLGTTVFLFTFLRHEWFVPTLALLVGIWAACWWVGKGQEATAAVGFGRWVQAGTVAGLVGWAAFSLLAPGDSLIRWEQPFSRDRVAQLRRGGATVMVDFSADWCLTCKFNLAYAIETDRVRSAIERNRVVPVLADWTDGSQEIKLALESLQSRSIPVLAIYPAATPGGECPEPIVLRDLVTESQVLDALDRAGPSRAAAAAVRAASAVRTGGR